MNLACSIVIFCILQYSLAEIGEEAVNLCRSSVSGNSVPIWSDHDPPRGEFIQQPFLAATYPQYALSNSIKVGEKIYFILAQHKAKVMDKKECSLPSVKTATKDVELLVEKYSNM